MSTVVCLNETLQVGDALIVNRLSSHLQRGDMEQQAAAAAVIACVGLLLACHQPPQSPLTLLYMRRCVF